ncbi:MAG TPA: hypothetical protein VFB01_15975 [Burkholderiales bacterium]|nr:hypothetical protein [Burkholderiales bacterium]
MEPFLAAYMAVWGAACAAAVAIVARDPGAFPFLAPEYRRFLGVRWKVLTFAVAAVGLTGVAPYTGDPTWDYVDAAFQSVLTFIGAPWAVGTLYLFLRRAARPKQAFVAACVWMFSASWSYDLYILVRDGRYPDTWAINIVASSVLYLAAGLLWNLDWRPGRGVTFAFLEPEWLAVRTGTAFVRVLGYALPFMLIAAASVAYFLVTAR